jgi:flagellar hook-associated protein 2
MGTISNSLSGSSATTSSNPTSKSVAVSASSNSSLFTGTSQYSSDFQNVISRAVAIADLPISLLQSQQSALSNQSTELGTFDKLFNNLQNAVEGLDTAFNGSSFQTDLLADPSSATAATDGKAVSPTIGIGAAEGVYAIQVDNIGSYTTSLSNQSWNNTPSPLGAPAYTLVAGGTSYTITPADNSAASVAAAINAKCSGVVNATVVQLTSTDTRISLQSATLGATTLDFHTAGLQQQQTTTGTLNTSMSANTWNPSAPTTTYKVLAGGQSYDITPDSNSMVDVMAAINGIPGHPVTASQVDLDPNGTHDYRIELQSSAAGPLDIQPSTPVSLQAPPHIGQPAQYEVGNSGVVAYSSSRDVTISPGITVTLTGTTTRPVDITVSRSTSAASTALAAFTAAYNAVVDEVAKQRGQTAGPLQGTTILSTLSQSLRSIGTYNDGSTGAVNSLAASQGGLGLDLGKDGHLTYTEATFIGTDIKYSLGVTSFFGSSTGGGFLKAASDILKSLEDPSTGLIQTSETDLTNQANNLATRISTRQDQVSAMQLQMQDQMARADALVATMEQQYTYLTSMFQAQQVAAQSYR